MLLLFFEKMVHLSINLMKSAIFSGIQIFKLEILRCVELKVHAISNLVNYSFMLYYTKLFIK